jgi:hypothetical protein
LTNIVQLFPTKKEQKKFVLTNAHINNYVATIQDVYYLSDSLGVEDLRDAVRVAYFYAKQMQKRIKELEEKISE